MKCKDCPLVFRRIQDNPICPITQYVMPTGYDCEIGVASALFARLEAAENVARKARQLCAMAVGLSKALDASEHKAGCAKTEG